MISTTELCVFHYLDLALLFLFVFFEIEIPSEGKLSCFRKPTWLFIQIVRPALEWTLWSPLEKRDRI
jgi:hypothetical protein